MDNDEIIRSINSLTQRIESLDQLRHNVGYLINQVDYLSNLVYNQQNTINDLIQILNGQTNLLNQLSGTIGMINHQVADQIVRSQYDDDLMMEVIQSNQTILNELHEIKTTIDAIKFYLQTSTDL